MQVSRLKYSPESKQDLSEIFQYTKGRYGLDQARSYVRKIDSSAQALITNPHLGKGRNEIKEGLRSLVVEKHILFYRLHEESVIILRILHTSRDIEELARWMAYRWKSGPED